MPIRLAAHLLIAVFLLMGALGLRPSQIALAERPAGEHGGRPGRPLLIGGPTANVSLALPAQVQIGASFSFTATFDNNPTLPINATTDVGYGPFIDIIFPVIGADGAGAQADDGIDFVSATYLGASVTAVQNTFGAANTGGCVGGLGPVNHPYAVALTTGAPLLVCGIPGNKLVTLQLPFGSFTPDQPPAVVTVNATLSNLADVGTALTFRARGGYQYGATPTNDWCCSDASIVSHPGTSTGWPGAPTTPTLLSLAKTYDGPEDETATGPNYPRQYTLTVDIATGQPVTNLTIVDTLPNNMQFVSVASTAPGASCTTPSTTTPGGTLTCNFGAVTGGATASDATLTLNFFIPLNNASGPVINAASGDDVTSLNTSSVTGSWDPIDSRDPITPVTAGGVCPTGCHTLTDKSIAIQKSVANIVDVGITGNSPGDTLQYTLTFQISDFFSFQDVVVTDVISDGQRVSLGFTPTLQVNGNGFTLTAAGMNAANYTIDNSDIGNTGPNPPPDGTNGTQTIIFRVSDELITRVASGSLIGGCVPVAGTGGPTPDCALYDDDATTGTIVFRAIIQQDFTDTYPSGDSSVDHGDILADDVTITGDLLSVTNNSTPTGGSEADDSAASLSIAFGSLAKSVYAVNGTVCAPCTTEITTDGVNPGDTVTFRLRYVQPSSDFEQTTITDYLPLPIFDATTVTAFSNTDCGVPGSGSACLGPADTYHSLNGPLVNEPNAVVVPVMITDGTNNFVRFSYADYDSTTNTTSEIDLLFTVTVSNQPFADGLFLTNQANAAEGTTNAGDQALDTIIQIRINEPVLIPKKSAVSTDSTASIVAFTPPIGAPIVFDTPGGVDGTPDWSGGVISSNYLAANPIDADLTGVDAGDLIKFAIVIENQGHSIEGAFDIAIRDAMPPEYVIPASGLNLEVFLGDGTAIAFTDLGGGLFGSGIQLVDPGTPPSGACQAHNATSGQNVIVITYDLQLSGSVSLNQNIINTTTLISYSGTEGGPNYIPSGLTDTATVTPITAPVKSIVTTSELHTSEAGTGDTSDPRLVAIGEIARYRITIGVAEGTVPNFRLHDNLPPGLIFLNDGTARVAFVSTGGAITSSTLSDPGLNVTGDESTVASVVPAFQLPDAAVSASDSTNDDNYTSGTDVFFKMGDLVNPDRDNNREFVVVEFNALVENISSNGTGTDLDNTATYRVGASTTDSTASNTVRVRTVQPSITMGKTIVSLPAQLDAGGQVTYRITVANGTGANVSTAFDIVVTDTLPAALTPGTATITPGGAGSGGFTGQVLTVTIPTLAPGETVTIDYTATINSSVTPAQIIANTGLATWTSLPGTNGTTGNGTGSNTPGAPGATNGERDGSGGVNNYTATSSQNFTIASPTITKQLTATSASHTSGSDAAIGEEITYDILLTFSEGATPADTVVDDLPTGLEVVTGTPEIITTAATSGGLLTADFNATIGTQSITTVAGDGGSVTFAFTNVVVPGDNVTTNNTLLLRFRARVTNINANQAGTTISNSATNQVGAGAPVASNTVTATVVEPSISFGKTIVSTPSPLDAGGVVQYRITYANGTGATVRTAMDVRITDALAAALLLNSTGSPDLVITSTAGVGAITNNSTTSNIDVTIASVPPGESVTIDFSPVIQNTITPGQVIDNVGNSTWTSLSGAATGERTGADGPGGALDDYAAVTTTQSFTAGTPTITKQLTATSASHTSGTSVTIGEEITYDILLTLPEGTTPSDTVVDDLPTGLAVVAATPEVITTAAASGGLLTADFNGTIGTQSITVVAGDGGSVRFDFTNIVTAGDNDTTNNTLLLRFRARVTDVAGNVGFPIAATISNSATNQVGAGAPTTSNTVNVTVVEPRPVITKTFTPASGTVNDVIRVTLTYQNTGTSNAYDVVITDSLSTVKFNNLAPVTTPAGFTLTQTPGAGIVTLQYAANAGTAVAPSATVVFEFDITLTASIVPGELLPNTANVTQTTTLDSSTTDGDDANERNTTTSGSATLTVNSVDLSIDKSHVGNFTLGVNGIFTISVRNVSPNAATGTITVSDTLPAELTFVSASGTDWTCINVGQAITCTHPGPAFGAAILPDIVVTVNPNTNGTFNNTATVSITGTDTNPVNNSDTDAVAVGSTNPDLTIAKTHPGNFTVGSVGSFSLTVTNLGAQATSGTITVTDTLPSELDYVSASGTGWTCAYAIATRTVSCTHPGPLFPSASLPVITLNVVPNTASGSPFTNNVTVLTAGDTNAGNNNASDSVTVNSGPSPDLTITKTHTSNFTVGTNGSFTLTVSNVGAAVTVGTITVTDTLPTALTFVSASGTGWTCSNVGQAVTCMHPGPLGVGASLPAITLTVNPNTDTGSPFSNTAAVSTPGDGNATNNSSTDSVIVTLGGAPDLIVTKTHTGNFLEGSAGTFTITVTNIGTGPTTAPITVTDTLVAQLAFVSASGTGWDCSASAGQNVSCTHPGPVAQGNSLPPITVTVNPPVGAAGTYNNTATVTTTGDSNNGNNTGSDTVVVDATPTPDLAIAKTHVGNFTVGVNNSFTLTVRNTGSGPTTAAIVVTDTLPAGLTFVSVSGTGWDCSLTVAPNVSCTHPGPVAAGGALPDLTLTVTPTVATPPAILNTANVATTGDTNNANDSSTDTVTVAPAPGPDLTIVKSHLSNFVVGVNGAYTLRVSNVGSAATTAVITVTDTLQTGLAFVSASSTDVNWDCTGSAGVNVTCTHPGPLAAGATLADLNLTVSVGAAAIGTFNNVATVATTGDTNGGNNSSIDSTTVTATPQPDLAISKSHTGTFAIGTIGTYTIRVRNVGSQATTGAIRVTDTLQTGLAFVSAAGTNWLCSAAGQTVTCDYQMPPATPPNSGETLPDITITVNVGIAALGVFNNVAVVSTTGDTNPANDTATDRTIVPYTIDLSLTNSVNNTTPNVGDTVVFTITVTNAGPHDATNVSVSGVTLGSLSLLSATPSQGTFDASTGVWTVGSVAVNGTQTLVLSARVTSGNPVGYTAQVATADQVDVDSTPGNNVAGEDDQAPVAIAPVAVGGGASAAPIILLDPTIAKRLPIENAVIGDVVDFVITVTNPNAVPVVGVSVADPLPALVDFVGVTTTQGTFNYDAATHTVTFDIGTMAAGQVVVIVVQARVSNRGQPPFDLCNEAEMRIDGQTRAKSGAACAHIIPGLIPATGAGPGPRELPLTAAVWLLAAVSPLATWWGWRRLRRRQE